MSRQFDTEYQALRSSAADEEEDQDAPPGDNVIPQIRPDQNRSQWNHIEDLDDFFIQVYQYYQRNGFMLMVIEDLLLLVQFAFVTLFGTFLTTCVDYPRLFHNGVNTTSYADVIYPVDTWSDRIHPMIVVCLIVACVVFTFRFIQFLCNLFKYYRMRSFFLYAMKISTAEMGNMTWHEVQRRLLEVQREVQMCIHKTELSELDLYHRMLRFKNYMVAMVNKDLLPVKFSLPFYGNNVFLSTGLKANYEMILFWGPWSPFENNWELKAEYKSIHNRKALASQLSKRILYIGIGNLVLCPIIFLWQIFYSFFRYAELAKREPGSLGSRIWSHYARLFLRHFNELDHEFNARLNRAYRPADKYMNSFISPLGSLVAKHVAFVAGSLLAVHVLLAVIDEDTLHVSHVLTTMTVLGVIMAICRVFIPDEHMVFMPEFLMRAILAQIHYMPDSWRGCANTYHVRQEFSQLFEYKIIYVLEELLSPVVTPFILCFSLRHRALSIVDFFRNFTVEVAGVGDVCSFAQMDIRRHGHPEWTTAPREDFGGERREEDLLARDAYSGHRERAEFGKTELSLMHFTLTNPEWRPKVAEDRFMTAVRNQAQREASMLSILPAENPLLTSSNSLSMMGQGYNTMVFSTFHKSLLTMGMMPSAQPQSLQTAENPNSGPHAIDESLNVEGAAGFNPSSVPPQSFSLASPPLRPPSLPNHGRSVMRGAGMRHLDLPLSGGGGNSLLGGRSTTQSPPFSTPPEGLIDTGGALGSLCGAPVFDGAMLEMMTAEMNLGALYMHDYHALRRSTRAGGFTSFGPGLEDDEAARRLWTSSFSSTLSSSQGPGGSLSTGQVDLGLDEMRGSGYQSMRGAGARMPNIQESTEDEEVLNNSGRVGSEKDHLLYKSSDVNT